MEQETVKQRIFTFLFTRLKVCARVSSPFLMVSVYNFLEGVTNWGPRLCDRGDQDRLACIIHEEWERRYGVYHHSKATDSQTVSAHTLWETGKEGITAPTKENALIKICFSFREWVYDEFTRFF